jgi:hypothetical protein
MGVTNAVLRPFPCTTQAPITHLLNPKPDTHDPIAAAPLPAQYWEKCSQNLANYAVFSPEWHCMEF